MLANVRMTRSIREVRGKELKGFVGKRNYIEKCGCLSPPPPSKKKNPGKLCLTFTRK